MTEPTDARILTHFAALEDPRDERGKDHLLIDIIALSVQDKSLQKVYRKGFHKNW